MATIQVEQLGKAFRMKKKQEGFAGSVKSLFKPIYEDKTAVDGITFSAKQGETVAFLGPNGAGKSTTIKMLTGILHPSTGSAEVLGCCPWTERTKLSYRIGSVFGQKSQLWYHLPPMDTFELMSRIYELRRSDYLQRRDALIERFELEPYMQTPVRKLSLGERMRCEIAASLLHRPQVLFLDEPTIGLDVVVKQRIRQLIRELNEQEGTTVFLTSHDAGDIEQLCERAIVINYGRIVFNDRVELMKQRYMTHKTIKLVLANDPGSMIVPGAEIVERSGARVTLSVDTSLTTIEAALTTVMANWRIVDVTVEDPPMEEIITRMYSDFGEEALS
ncbi:ATP-binding cassette domain-containing protein [Paenibacillus sp. NEAU-GSW1]|uniref:ABC transporter ATP-binding protein n=1 Tax=Paenibacillus sp. NEAU-GSW1 TaxID=2682486 RepID=UPI0012E2080D|nr:ATP-binding cassette domain-containing protein [Paenibacillus sp. NEAU-GSW1]MUT66558.1 ATP-binding cassette domain-containing protein [Paenibacillus sp. NEAU-GSW1]